MSDIHCYIQRLEREIELLNASAISKENKELIRRFYSDNLVTGLSKPRLVKLMEVMRGLSRMLNKSFDAATIDDLKRVVVEIESREWSVWTKVSYRTILKKFYKWLRGKDEYPAEVKWIKTTVKAKDIPKLSQEDLITEYEIARALDACDHPRSKAFLGVLSESGCRISEIGTLRIRNVFFDKHGAILNVHGKTGSRRIRIIRNSPYLATWLNVHPFKRNPDAPVWINVGARNHHDGMKYCGLAKLIRDAFKKAGIKKRCNPHLFRHSRASIMANHLTEFQMNQYFGWTQGSDMASTYVHLSGKEIDGAILAINGLKPKEETKPVAPKICSRCETVNTIESIYCTKCAGILDEKTAIDAQRKLLQQEEANTNVNNLMSALLKDADVQKLLAEKMNALNLRIPS